MASCSLEESCKSGTQSRGRELGSIFWKKKCPRWQLILKPLQCSRNYWLFKHILAAGGGEKKNRGREGRERHIHKGIPSKLQYISQTNDVKTSTLRNNTENLNGWEKFPLTQAVHRIQFFVFKMSSYTAKKETNSQSHFQTKGLTKGDNLFFCDYTVY